LNNKEKAENEFCKFIETNNREHLSNVFNILLGRKYKSMRRFFHRFIEKLDHINYVTNREEIEFMNCFNLLSKNGTYFQESYRKLSIESQNTIYYLFINIQRINEINYYFEEARMKIKKHYGVKKNTETPEQINARRIAYAKEKSEAENRLKTLRSDDSPEYISLCKKYRFENEDYMICKSHLYKKYKGRKREIDKILLYFIENKWYVECKTLHVKKIKYNLYPGLIVEQLLNDQNDPTKLVNDI